MKFFSVLKLYFWEQLNGKVAMPEAGFKFSYKITECIAGKRVNPSTVNSAKLFNLE
jgi:hypothetical protein